MTDERGLWRFWIDRGGTFTDVVARDPQGELHVTKLLSEDPEHYQDAAVEAIERLLAGAALDENTIAEVRMGTTVATNALLERHGARVGLVIGQGFGDLLEIGNQARPELFALAIDKPTVIAEQVHELPARLLADGHERRPLDPGPLRRVLERWQAEGIEALAVALPHAYAFPDHELAVAELAHETGFRHVALSHEVAAEIGLTARADTTAADAYLTPILRDYVERVRARVRAPVQLRFMQSSGGLADAEAFSGKDAVLSGPAGGVVGCAEVARQAGFPQALGFDMGGTSTDVCRVDLAAGYERTWERTVAGVRLRAPMLHIHTIASGGGSLLGVEGRRLTVGPDSAGADPGPVCYRRQGGLLAITDANAVLGRVQPEFFPRCFGPQADQALDLAAARAALEDRAREVALKSGDQLSPEELAAGYHRIANADMAQAIREISVARGYDVSDYALVCFGGAGAQHACGVARQLGVKTVVLSELAGVLSAYGIGLADVVHTGVQALLVDLEDPALPERFAAEQARLESEGRAAVLAQGLEAERVEALVSADLRYQGVDQTLNVPLSGSLDPDRLRADFASAHQRLYGFTRPEHALELVNVRLETVGRSEPIALSQTPSTTDDLAPQPARQVQVWFDVLDARGRRQLVSTPTPVYRRQELRPGLELQGPCLVVEEVSTVVVEPGWAAHLDDQRHLVLRDHSGQVTESLATAADPVTLEIMSNLFMSIAEQMGLTLRRVSLSVNIKERLDFSCALFDPQGGLVANAPHIPVHLGAMSESVRAVLEDAELQPGDVYLSNDPFRGGSHLPDVTVISPVWLDPAARPGSAPDFFVASRGHHADIGGVIPGSMPPFSRTIEEEGVRLHALLLVRDGVFRRGEVRAALLAGPYPVRGVEERLADLEAQIAANARGLELLRDMARSFGREVVAAYMGHVQDDAALAFEDAIEALPDGQHSFTDYLDEGARIRCMVTIAGRRAKVDFTGTDPRLSGNLNAPRAVAMAAVLYVFRSLVARPIPLNAGCFRPLEIVIPAGCLLAPEPPDAVVGGNVETSQRVVDVVLGALGKAGASQGTMNNLTFGTDAFGYYETICGGAGASLGHDGASAVHTHMTNTRITDPEVLEHRYPVVVRRFGVRRGSGGEAVFRGGHGAERVLEFRQPMTAAILSERRGRGPWGLHGAGSGQPGKNVLVRADGSRRELPGKVRLEVARGDVLEVLTPGAGGYDPSPREWATMAPRAARALFRQGRYAGPTPQIALGRVQANLVVLPVDFASDFAAYCAQNPRPCPLIEQTQPGSPISTRLAPGADLRTDLPRYLRFKALAGGGFDRREFPQAPWRADAVAFLLGCSFSLEGALLAAGLPVRHVEEGKNVPMFRTQRQTNAVGPFGGRLMVSMRPMTPAQAERASEISRELWFGHGAPLQIGDAASLGIEDLRRPEWGDPVTLQAGEVPVFWACGVTSQVALEGALSSGALPWAVTHAPGHMLIGDLTAGDLLAQA